MEYALKKNHILPDLDVRPSESGDSEYRPESDRGAILSCF